jgi:hypothetical protein
MLQVIPAQAQMLSEDSHPDLLFQVSPPVEWKNTASA